jgi:MoaD family protein
MVRIKIVYFSLLRELTETPEEYLEVGVTVRSALQTLFNKYGKKMRELILKENDNAPIDSLIINVNGKSIKFLHELDTNLKEGDKLTFFFAAGGG